jgi:hypothetical protein
MRNRRVPLHLSRPTRPAGGRAPFAIPSGPKENQLAQRLKKVVDQSGVADQWAALILLAVAWAQSRASKFPDFDFRRVFEILWSSEKAKEKEENNDMLDEAVRAWSLAREKDPESLVAEMCRSLVREAHDGKVSREEVHKAFDFFFDAFDELDAKRKKEGGQDPSP